MNHQEWQKAEEVLNAVWASPRENRELALAQLCGKDQKLMSEVKSLLEADEQARNWQAPSQENTTVVRQFGPYRLEKMIGRGGMGAVYLAHRTDGNVEHKVAVKIIGLPFELEPFQDRFRQERQILATLNHPNITHFIDGGVTNDGELYLIIEYVDGLTIDEFARVRNLDEATRLDLLEQVAAAVAYAHQNLIVHRDLKPGNILVSNEGTVKLLDFGTAKILDGRVADGSTSAGLMSVGYASPEQLRGDPATTLTDVYSLGVVLYELLSGKKAFTGGLFARMDAPGNTLQPLPGDLGLIVRKAMSTVPNERYSSVEQMVVDLRRYRSGKPVMAHPESASYCVRKFIRRNRLPVAAGIVAFCAVVGGSIATAWEARRAEARFEQVRELGKYLVFDIHGGLQGMPGSTALQKQVAEKALGFLDALSSDPSADQTLRLELASGYQRLGDVLGNPNRANLGERKKAIETYDKALSILSPVLNADPSNLDARWLSAQIRIQQSGTRDFGDKAQEGLQLLSKAVEDLRWLLAQEPNDLKTRMALAAGLQLLAKRTSAGGGVTETTGAAQVEAHYREAEAVLQPAIGGHADVLFQLAQIEYGRAILWGSTNPNLAVEHHRKTSSWLNQLPSSEANLIETRRLRANNLLNLGWAEGQTHAYSEAIRNISEAEKILEAWAAVDPGNTSAQYQLTTAYRSRGIVHSYNQDRRKAIEDFRAALSIHRQLSSKDPGNKVYRYLQGELLSRIGNLHQQSGEKVAARNAAQDGIEILVALAEPQTASLSHLFGACRWLSETAVASLRKPKLAAAYCQRAIDITKGQDPDGWEGLSTARAQLGDRTGAIEAAKRAIALLPPTLEGKPVSEQRRTMEAALRQLEKR